MYRALGGVADSVTPVTSRCGWLADPSRSVIGHGLAQAGGLSDRYRGRVSAIPWWGLPLIAAVFALAGAAVAQFVTFRDNRLRRRVRRTRRWYEERKTAYITLMAAFERALYRLRATYATGNREPDPLVYLDDVGPALMQVRLLASGPVRSAAMAVHLLLEQLHGGLKPASVPGVEPEKHARELLAQVPLVMQQFEAAIRDELHISTDPPRTGTPEVPASLNGDLRDRARALFRRSPEAL